MRSEQKELTVAEERQVLLLALLAPRFRLLVRDALEVFGGEVGRVGDGAEVRDEGCLNGADRVPINAVEEGVALDLGNIEAGFRVGEQPADEVLRLAREMDVIWEVEICGKR